MPVKRKHKKSLKELQENTTKQVKELNKTIQDLKMELETTKKSQWETTLEIENLGKRSGAIDASITNRIQEMEDRISGAEDTIENIDTIKENAKCKMSLTTVYAFYSPSFSRYHVYVCRYTYGLILSDPFTCYFHACDVRLLFVLLYPNS
jgi:DNA repair exonuclease SbcCD ATPase subunit